MEFMFREYVLNIYHVGHVFIEKFMLKLIEVWHGVWEFFTQLRDGVHMWTIAN
jgi:hypothetical protein